MSTKLTIMICTAAVCAVMIWKDQQGRAMGPVEPERVSLGVYRVTAYCPCEKCCGAYSRGDHYRQTANGHRIQPGEKLVAAPKSFSFGTLLDVPGYGRSVPVLDRGGAIKGRKLDVFFPTHQAALNWGVKNVEIFKVCH